ncbi:hypothetical protein N7462_001268 [Penicillium macrosclerotiorum]|uniref:uncharacterized protein n=1 Tax=Penicillium macrosclerotiorum TaxID=303699 RepID=UPI002546D898|nr:uncharacterized protein N7462_001268 [Penicillium macrosclerotiorum]KAJ5691845.1 hypothetical protein N7462_001268 [Penicillium macrosclerotiorum]
MNSSGPLFVAQEAICFYPISTIYDSCPRYLFYALLLASCVTRWTGWLADVFLGAAATYAGTAAIEAFILLASPQKTQDPSVVTIPLVPDNTTLWNDFPQLVTNTSEVTLQPASLEMDGDAVLAIVITGYLVFLPLQCWSRVLTNERARNFLFYIWNILMLAGSICALVNAATKGKIPPQHPPFEKTTSDGWQSSWRTSSWNNSVWETFTNVSKWGQLGDICYNPCFNSSQILRQPSSLQSWVASKESELSHPNRLWNKVVYSNRYIYSLIILCVILNFVLLTYKFLPYRSRIPSAQIVVIWQARKTIWHDFKDELVGSFTAAASEQNSHKSGGAPAGSKSSNWDHIQPLFKIRFLKAFLRALVDFVILFGLLFSMIVSPFTIIAFVAWIEWTIYNDGPSQENPQQVGQWSYFVSIGLLVLSAGILMLKYRIASKAELDSEIEGMRKALAKLEQQREARSASETAALNISENAIDRE